ncbi:MAG TPA: glycosyltransferase [Burkholderiaceae bacterium]|nr:glycosyltransferase [Burkholderiaceae bacterium]
MQANNINKKRLAIFIPSLNGGGAERVMVTLANNFAELGFSVDLVLARAEGPYLNEVSGKVNIVGLKIGRAWIVLVELIRYLRRAKPVVMLAALGHANVLSILARAISGVPTRLVVSERNNFSAGKVDARNLRERYMGFAMKWAYPRADGVIAVSGGVADDLAKAINLPRAKIDVVYNPVYTEKLRAQSLLVPDHPWLTHKEVPVILGMGRLAAQKDFSTLLRAFAVLRQTRDVRLIILGQGPLHVQLLNLIAELGLKEVVDLPGFMRNPFAFLKHADLFVLSSRYEGLPNALIQAMACGAPVVSTDCPSGPMEILENGKWGQLVPVGDVQAMAKAMAFALDDQNPPDVVARASEFDVDTAVNGYLHVMLPEKQN